MAQQHKPREGRRIRNADGSDERFIRTEDAESWGPIESDDGGFDPWEGFAEYSVSQILYRLATQEWILIEDRVHNPTALSIDPSYTKLTGWQAREWLALNGFDLPAELAALRQMYPEEWIQEKILGNPHFQDSSQAVAPENANGIAKAPEVERIDDNPTGQIGRRNTTAALAEFVIDALKRVPVPTYKEIATEWNANNPDKPTTEQKAKGARQRYLKKNGR